MKSLYVTPKQYTLLNLQMTKTLTQTQIENLSTEEYCNFLSYGDDAVSAYVKDSEENIYFSIPNEYTSSAVTAKDARGTSNWISTLDSTMYLVLTSGHKTIV